MPSIATPLPVPFLRSPRSLPLLFLFFTVALFGCDTGGQTVGIDEQENPSANVSRLAQKAPEGLTHFGFVVGFSNTKGTAEATERIGYAGVFAPKSVLQKDAKIFVSPRPNDRDYLFSGLRNQYSYSQQNHERPTFIYWMIGLQAQETPTASDLQKEQVADILALLQRISRGAPILINPMSDYTEDSCETPGPYGPEVAVELVDYLEANFPDDFVRIERFPILAPEDTQDGCHPTDEIYERDAEILVNAIESVLDVPGT